MGRETPCLRATWERGCQAAQRLQGQEAGGGVGCGGKDVTLGLAGCPRSGRSILKQQEAAVSVFYISYAAREGSRRGCAQLGCSCWLTCVPRSPKTAMHCFPLNFISALSGQQKAASLLS